MKRLLRALFLLPLFSWFVVTSAQAADHYVLAGATGAADGSDWTNAYTTLPATLTRGDTYYIASGSYSPYTFNTATSGTTLITVKKATVADHGTATGWSDSFASGQALFTAAAGQIVWDFETSYWLVDGQTGGGPGSSTSWTTGFGFKLSSPSTTNVRPVILSSGTTTNVTIRHVEAQGNGGEGNIAPTGTSNDIVVVGGGSAQFITISYAYFYNAGRCIYFLSGKDLTFEYVYTGKYESQPLEHSELASIWNFGSGPNPTRIVFRYGVVSHIEGTGGYIIDTQATGSLQVYGNVFVPDATSVGGNGMIGGWTTAAGGETFSRVEAYNNTFIGSAGQALGTAPQAYSGNIARNNLFYNVADAGGGNVWGTVTHNHFISTPTIGANTSTGTGNPFVDYPNLNFALTGDTPTGFTLNSPYATDYLGNTRSSSGVWTRGAIEFSGIPTARPAAPTNLGVQ